MAQITISPEKVEAFKVSLKNNGFPNHSVYVLNKHVTLIKISLDGSDSELVKLEKLCRATSNCFERQN